MGNQRTNKLNTGTDLIGTEEILSLNSNELISRLGSQEAGLSSEEASRRLETYGYNEVAQRQKGLGLR